jgi:hypothetical protein
MAVFFLFLLSLTVGCLTTQFWVPGPGFGRGYFQMNALVVLGLLGLVMAVWFFYPLAPFGNYEDLGSTAMWFAVAGAFVYYGTIWREAWSASHWAAAATLIAAGIAFFTAGHALVASPTPLPHRSLLLTVNLGASALLLGWSLVTMLLGHWYLVVPGLRFKHQVLFCQVLLGTVFLRILAVGLSVAAAATVDPLVEPHPLRILIGLTGHGMFFWFRLLWGLAIPLLLAVMSLSCARRRANQSATGILYVLVMGSLIGEITALYLTLITGVPV